jgi:hypothetical protein
MSSASTSSILKRRGELGGDGDGDGKMKKGEGERLIVPGAHAVFALAEVLVFAAMGAVEVVEVAKAEIVEGFAGNKVEFAKAKSGGRFARCDGAACSCKGLDKVGDGEVVQVGK